MPSIGVSTALAVSRRIAEAVEREFEGPDRTNARKLLALSSRFGGGRYGFILSWGGFILSLVFIGLSAEKSVFGIFAGVAGLFASLIGMHFALTRLSETRQEITALIASDPAYWQPIVDKLERIVLEAGKFNDGLPPSQATRVR